jgi:hypothetical protein
MARKMDIPSGCPNDQVFIQARLPAIHLIVIFQVIRCIDNAQLDQRINGVCGFGCQINGCY